MKFATRAIHAGQEPDPTTGAINVPIYQTSTYVQEEIGKHKGYEYARTGNPTRTALEACLASLEGANHGLCFGSGLGASMNIMHLLSAGDHVVVGDDVYGGTFRLFDKVLSRFGVTFSWVDARDVKNIEKAIKPETKMIWLETPTNPLLQIIDIKAITDLAKSKKIATVVDNTFASPYLQNPLALGADIVVHSATKYLGGHSDVVGGAILTSDEEMYERLKFHQNAVGSVPGPMDCFLILRGVKTLAVRMEAHQKNAMAIAKFLENKPQIERIIYPGLAAHPQHDLAKKQMNGFGAMVSIVVKGGLENANKFASSTKLFALAESLGGVESLICHPVSMTHGSIPKEVREARGIVDGLVRLSVGIEDTDDLLADVEQALAKVPQLTEAK
ncbi:cystathionine gamma-synthase [Candidatus Obscuribacterales bacterium]|jgi:cystathionine beta-lyase/cystathionine gamma-synthase|nr:cystathionine gamma-synthase [Candidatus Obscuribacterales bacterium]MBX3138228.1 cystathionine gamma-synthase [Candidatus Obscuribacterales bacterium]MBX3153239.1 cystathionine gamma-synthase [Candidatus Obscuribacterales bacterium]